MSLKANILAAVIAFMLIVLLANAAEDNGNESQISFGNSSNQSAAVLANGVINNDTNTLENNESLNQGNFNLETEEPNSNGKSAGTPVTASFGIYLQIVG